MQLQGPGVSLSLLLMWEHLLLRADACRMGISGIFDIISPNPGLCHVGLSASESGMTFVLAFPKPCVKLCVAEQ